MRFDLLLAQYLYQHKKLNLPGIGIFEANGSVYSTDDSERQKQAMDGISFINKPVTKADDGLIDFIKEQTGKMKPLAISDLESYLTLGKQFLYIGKPFYLEGIGTLQLAKDGRIEFIPGQYMSTKLEDPNIERSESKTRSVNEENRIRQESTSNTFKKILLGLLIVAGIAIVGWGGYYFYNMYVNQQSNTLVEDAMAPAKTDTAASAGTSLEDSILTATTPPQSRDTQISRRPAVIAPETPAGEGNYKFIIETTTDKARALRRLTDLKSYGQPIQLQTSDSVNFKLFFVLPATPADTARLRDSINRFFYGNSPVRRVKIEK